jgi:NADPH-dependent 2,4-dienoyl-CoA reductase/sulfur reductase-like enzyme/rhodanese-related sulfurtransferase
MSKRILIIGGVAGGASVAARARRIDEQAEIIMFEKGPYVSFSNCALPYYLSGTVEKAEQLVLMSPERFKKQYNIEARVDSEVIKINRSKNTVTVRKTTTKEEYEEHYDTLVLSTGAKPILPKNLDGIDLPNVFSVRNVPDIAKLKAYIDTNGVEDIAVIGGGFIGVEVAENLRHAGKNVALIEAANQIMAPFDYDMVQILHKEMTDNGINLIVEDGIEKITSDAVILVSGRKVHAKVVVVAIGVVPETELAQEAGLKIGVTGGIKVNHNYQTNDCDIYSVGDAIEVHNRLTHKPSRLPLAGPAQMQARAVADSMYGMYTSNLGVIGSSAVRIFSLNAASTGLNEKAAKAAGISHDAVYIIPMDKVGLMPGSAPMHFKLIYEYPSGRILGAQAIGTGNVDKRVDVIATMISMGGTLEDLKGLELCYSPVFSTAKDVVNYAALVGLNVINEKVKQVPVARVRELVESKAFIVDVRERGEYEYGHLIGAVNIPLSELRQRFNEIPGDIPVYLHCRSSQRSYNAYMALQNMGYKNVINISGSFLGICLYEYYNDMVTGREKIVTNYNFE